MNEPDQNAAPQVLEGAPEEPQVLALPRSAVLRGESYRRLLAEGHAFEQELQRLRESDRGKLSALRRNVGETLGSARNVAWIHGRLWGLRRRHEEQFFLLATIFDWNRKPSIRGDFGESMRRLAEGSSQEAVERRFRVLLDADFDRIWDAQEGMKSGGGELAFRLRQMVKLAASREIGVNWPLLLADLCFWDAPGKPVQKKWARNFYAPSLNIEDNQASSAATSTSNASQSASQGDTNAD